MWDAEFFSGRGTQLIMTNALIQNSKSSSVYSIGASQIPPQVPGEYLKDLAALISFIFYILSILE